MQPLLDEIISDVKLAEFCSERERSNIESKLLLLKELIPSPSVELLTSESSPTIQRMAILFVQQCTTLVLGSRVPDITIRRNFRDWCRKVNYKVGICEPGRLNHLLMEAINSIHGEGTVVMASARRRWDSKWGEKSEQTIDFVGMICLSSWLYIVTFLLDIESGQLVVLLDLNRTPANQVHGT